MIMGNLKPGTKAYLDAVINWYTRMVEAYKAMPEEEKRELEAWKKCNLHANSLSSITDWPGWERYIGRKPS